MPGLVIANIGQLLTWRGPARARTGAGMRDLGLVRDGAVLILEGKIAAAGPKGAVLGLPEAEKARIIDAGGRVAMPGFVDSHSHPVFAAPRLDDFAMRLAGRTYREIAGEGGGILASVAAVRAASEESLVEELVRWAGKFIEYGTTTLEAKSGYGLDLENELKMLRAIRRAGELTALEFVPTFFGAHAVPAELRGRGGEYVRRVCREMIPAVAREGLARFADVFCEEGYFSEAEAEEVLKAGLQAGLRPKIHADQLSSSGGSRVAARVRAVSADHMDRAGEADVAAVKDAGAVVTLLPAADYFLGAGYPPARAIIEAGAAVALATDFNPGTAPCWSMPMVLSIACTQMRMTIEEALTAATINGAWALELGSTHGSLEPGKQADIVILDALDYREAAYYFGGNPVHLVIKRGSVVHAAAHLRPFD